MPIDPKQDPVGFFRELREDLARRGIKIDLDAALRDGDDCDTCVAIRNAKEKPEGMERLARTLAEQVIDLKRQLAERVPLPAQMEELREKLLDLQRWFNLAPWPVASGLERVDELLRLVPVQHDDQVGGKPVVRP